MISQQTSEACKTVQADLSRAFSVVVFLSQHLKPNIFFPLLVVGTWKLELGTYPSIHAGVMRALHVAVKLTDSFTS